MFTVPALLIVIAAVDPLATNAAAPTALTPVEKAAGWSVLFNGQSTDAWKGYRSDAFPSARWKVEDGCVRSVGGAGNTIDLVSKDTYGDFELTLEFKTPSAANSGIIYRATEKLDASWQTGPEFQILDDPGAGEKSDSTHSCGAMYDLYQPVPAKVLAPAGSFNEIRIRLWQNHLEHWLNGVRVVACDLNSDDWTKRIAASKFKGYEGFGVQPRGHIVLQDHGDAVWFRNIKVRALDAPLPGDVKLFDGKSMNGWTYYLEGGGKMEDVWSVKDGMIICKGNPAGYIRTEKDFTNYVLKVEWQYPAGTKSDANSGVLLRMIEKDMVWPKSIEAQLMTGNAGDFYSIEGFPIKGDPARTKGRNIKKIHGAEYPLGQWNEYEIIVDHGEITLNVNGQTLNHATDVLETPGKICLQSEGSEIHFRNIHLAPLP
jgi:Domain of Unknown Function (DUF1080)